MFSTPILFLVFNRPDETLKVFEHIKRVKPKTLFIAADGPRKNNSDDIENCRKVKEIFDQIDWECTVEKLFRDKNLGCGKAVSSAIDWFFKHNAMGIILEDDCLPSTEFFDFCKELLIKYKNIPQIYHITGLNFLKKDIGDGSYYFTHSIGIWGWATWRDRWEKYQFAFSEEHHDKISTTIKSKFKNPTLRNYFLNILSTVSSIDTWDYQWLLTVLINDGLTIRPNNNMIVNIGFGTKATHTKNVDPRAYLKHESAGTEITHPKTIEASEKVDLEIYDYIAVKKINRFNRIKTGLNQLVKKCNLKAEKKTR